MIEPLFSVIGCAYNQENSIAQTLNCVIEQEHGYPYEIIIGEDCSTDGTRDVLLKYREKYPNIVKLILNEQNLGMLKNFFNVINQCSGKYIMQAGGDDYWLPGKVALQIPFMEFNPQVGMCGTNYRAINSRDEPIEIRLYDKRTVTFEERINDSSSLMPVTACMRRDLVLEYIKNIDPINRNWKMEDYPMTLWFACNSQIDFLDEITCVRRHLDGSVSRPKKFYVSMQYCNSVFEVKKFFLDLYGTPSLKENFENEIKAWQSRLPKPFMKDYLANIKINWNKKFPFEECLSKKFTRIYIFGAGLVGNEFQQQIDAHGGGITNLGFIDNFVTTENTELSAVRRIGVHKPDILKNAEYDCIVLAYNNWLLIPEICECLLNIGVDCDKIL